MQFYFVVELLREDVPHASLQSIKELQVHTRNWQMVKTTLITSADEG